MNRLCRFKIRFLKFHAPDVRFLRMSIKIPIYSDIQDMAPDLLGSDIYIWALG